MKKILIVITSLLFLPIIVLADSDFNTGQKMANDYIYSLPEYSRYLLSSGDLPFGYDTTGVVTADGFSTGGFLNEQEFYKSRNSGVSWLAPGIQYWLTSGKALDLKVKDSTKSGVRVTEYVRHETKVKGIGTMTTPWEFVDGYTFKIGTTDKTKGEIIGQSEYNHVQLGQTLTFKLEMKGSYVIDTKECQNNKNAKFEISTTGTTSTITISKIIGDYSCNINFGAGCQMITFDNNGGQNGMADKPLYYRYGNGWFSNNICTNKVNDIVAPTKDGYAFMSYKSGAKVIINNEPSLEPGIKDSEMLSVTSATASWKANQYGFDYNPDYNDYGTNYSAGARVQSFDLKIVSEDGRVIEETKDISDYCSAGTCGNTKSEYNSTYYITNVKYREGYVYDSYTLRSDSQKGSSNLSMISSNSTSFTFKHSNLGDIWFSINTKPLCTTVVFYKNDGSNVRTTRTFCVGNYNRFEDNWTNIKNGYSLLGWSTNASDGSAMYSGPSNETRANWVVPDSFIIANAGKTVNLYAIYHITTATIYYSANGGTVKSSSYIPLDHTHSDGTPHEWRGKTVYFRSADSTIDGRHYSGLAQFKIDPYYPNYIFAVHLMYYSELAGAHGDGLADYNNPSWIYITRPGKYVPNGKQWKCLSGNCKYNTYDQYKNDYHSQDFCNNSRYDCNVVLGVNWQ